MAKVKEFSRPVLREIGEAITNALKGVEKQYGISITEGGYSFYEEAATLKLELATIGADGKKFDRLEENFKNGYRLFPGLKESDFGRVITSHGKRFKVVGLNLRGRRYPIVGEDLNSGRRFRLTVGAVTGKGF